jgi:hypothetical protein
VTQKRGSSLFFAIALALVVLACTTSGAIFGGVAWMSTRSDAPAGDAPVRAVASEHGDPIDPLRPDVALTVTGACEGLRFDGTIRVTTATIASSQMLVIASVEDDALTGQIMLQSEGMNAGAELVLNGQPQDTMVQITRASTDSWQSAYPGTHGTIRFATWEPRSGIADVTFEDATLMHISGSGTACTINGRLQTRGLTMGL